MSIPTNLPQRANIQGFWKLDEESGTRYDETTNDNDLTDNATVLYGTGKIGNAADFERDNSEYLSITDALQTGLDITGEITILFWIKFETIGAHQYLIMKLGATNDKRSYGIYKLAADTIEVQLFYDAVGGNIKATSASTVNTGTWYHIGFTLNQTTDLMQVYIDGLANGSAIAYTGNINDGTAAFVIGAGELDLIGNNTDGLIDEPIVWNTCLTPAEVLQVKNITAYSYGGSFLLNFI